MPKWAKELVASTGVAVQEALYGWNPELNIAFRQVGGKVEMANKPKDNPEANASDMFVATWPDGSTYPISEM
eukprot:305113-Lingulodinium_polyedra.AAC.1